MASGGRARATVGLPALYHNRSTDRSDGLDYAARRRWDRPVYRRLPTGREPRSPSHTQKMERNLDVV